MKFFSKELSAKLQEMGCKSKSEMFYTERPNREPYSLDECRRMQWIDEVEAFTISDFLSDEPYALENCKKVFGSHVKSKHEFVIHLLLVAPDQEAFLWEALGGKGEK